MTKQTADQIAESAKTAEYLRELLKGVTCIYTCMRKVSAKGRTQEISLHIVKDGEIHSITFRASKVLTYKLNATEDALKVKGGGMNMGLHVVSTLARLLTGDERKFQQRWV